MTLIVTVSFHRETTRFSDYTDDPEGAPPPAVLPMEHAS
jgi:hypothetical protein